MSSLRLDKNDRVLIVAPHPDDESLATAGVLQRARQIGAALRVVFATDGDNNPWPQRAAEKRWRIDEAGRRRWGQRRRAEAVAALEALSIPQGCACFLAYPDQGLTSELIGGGHLLSDLITEIDAFHPSVVIAPSPADRHPDHNALGLLVYFAREQFRDRGTEWLSYILHGRDPQVSTHDTVFCDLSDADHSRKHEAMLCHESQMILSRRRFLGMIARRECFIRETCGNFFSYPDIEVSASRESGLKVHGKSWELAGARASVLMQPRNAATIRLSYSRHKKQTLESAAFPGKHTFCMILPPAMINAASVWVKLAVPWRFLDIAGWRHVPLTATQAIRIPDAELTDEENAPMFDEPSSVRMR
ncbi:MAG: PIG-L family deacetylase [Burkholderiales bacterium]|nr:PIG-L family deacetylase [Burkholderiales bacterium]